MACDVRSIPKSGEKSTQAVRPLKLCVWITVARNKRLAGAARHYVSSTRASPARHLKDHAYSARLLAWLSTEGVAQGCKFLPERPL